MKELHKSKPIDDLIDLPPLQVDENDQREFSPVLHL